MTTARLPRVLAFVFALVATGAMLGGVNALALKPADASWFAEVAASGHHAAPVHSSAAEFVRRA